MGRAGLPPPLFEKVLILKDVRERQNRAKRMLILKGLTRQMDKGNEPSARPGRVGISAPQRCRSDLKVEMPERLRVADGGVGREEKQWQATALHRRGWARRIKGEGITKSNRCKEELCGHLNGRRELRRWGASWLGEGVCGRSGIRK